MPFSGSATGSLLSVLLHWINFMTDCQRDQMASGKPYPRSCLRCGLGPCQKYKQNEYPEGFPEEAKKPMDEFSKAARPVSMSDKELADQYRDELTRALQPVTEVLDRAKAQGLILGFNIQGDILGRNVVQQITVARHY